ncbi:MAG: ABC transporter ATP-binding protein [Negativicutes bacterium]|jgi:ATP-binding cassette subfamily C protein
MRTTEHNGVFAQIRQYSKSILSHDNTLLAWLILLTLLIAVAEAAELWLLVPCMAFFGVSTGTAGAPEFVTRLLTGVDGKYALLLLLVAYLTINFALALMQKKQSVASMSFRAGFSRSLSNQLYKAFANARWQYIITKRRTDVVHALTNDLRNIDMGTYLVIQFLSMLPIALAQLLLAFFLSPKITALTIALSAVFFFALRKSNDKLNTCAMNMHGLQQNSIKLVSEHLAGIKEVKSYGVEAAQIDNFTHTNQAVEQQYIQFARIFSKTGFIYKTGAALAVCLFLIVALVIMKTPLAGLVIIIVIFSRIWPFLSTVQTSFQFSIMMLPSWNNFQTWLDECLNAEEFPCADCSGNRVELADSIRLDKVSFGYNGQQPSVIDELSLELKRGSITALTGPSGSGKSTLADLLLGLLTPQQGQVLLDGAPLTGQLLADWRNSIGYVPQETVLFSGTIRDNLLLAKPDAGDDELHEAVQLAAADFIAQLPAGLDTDLGERGSGLSGGEKQRIALARAFLRKPALLVLDEATSALDIDNELRIKQALSNLRGKTTVLLIAHRPALLEAVDTIVALEDGRIQQTTLQHNLTQL